MAKKLCQQQRSRATNSVPDRADVSQATEPVNPGDQSRNRHWQQSGALVQTLAGRWTLAILAELANGSRRYQDFHDALDGISSKVLTETLRRAERDGLIGRHLDAERVETATLYELTDLGRSLDAPLAAFAGWIDTNWQAVEAARHHWDQLPRAGQ
jgi:DNA-binding HxlR family transcriptional regulator